MAIKVNNTTVINDSRALQNITSVDSTTKSAIETAGVGGGLKFLGETTLSSNVSYIDYNFPSGYGYFRIHLDNMKGSSSQYSSGLKIRLKDSGGTLITSSSSYGRIRTRSSSGIDNTINSIEAEVNVATSNSSNGSNLVVDIYNPKDSNYNTLLRMFSMSYITFQTGYGPSWYAEPVYAAPVTQANNYGIRFYVDNYGFNSGTNYKIWGAVDA